MSFVLSVVLLLLCTGNVFLRHAYPCASSHRARLYLDHAVEGTVTLDNDSVTAECHLEIVTCPSCVISLNLSYANVTHECAIGRNASEDDCDCYWIQIFEQPYEKESGRSYCGGPDMCYITQTRSVQVWLRAPPTRESPIGRAFLQYHAQRNRQLLVVSPGQQGHISSPYFPSNYPHDLNQEYIISCPRDCVLSILFTDFQLSSRSIIEIFDWHGVRLDAATGAMFRPPNIISYGSQIVLRFYANGGTGSGYRATFMVYEGTIPHQTLTNCGGYVDDLGGAVTMMDMTSDMAYYDCVWIVRPSKSPNLHFRTHVYLKIVDFNGMGADSKMTVHEGSTSEGRLLEVLRMLPNESERVEVPREHVVSIATGFYVRLKGSFDPQSRLAIAYAAFSYARGDADCLAVADHLCNNRRCLARQLMCDGFDQCGDGTDEPVTCDEPANGTHLVRTNWYSHTPNYLFPKIDPFTDLRTATLIFVTSSLGLIVLATALFALLYRANIRARRSLPTSASRNVTDHIHIIADLLEEDIVDIESYNDEPPIYEAPPCYEECISKEVRTTELKPRRSARRNKRKFRRRAVRRKAASSCSSPPPGYEELVRTCSGRRRWRSHGELISTGGQTLATYLAFRSDAASDSELLNIYGPSSSPCNCNADCNCAPALTQLQEKRIKYNTS